MELGTTYIILAYVGPILGIVGFIITPGLTHIRPWLLEKFNKDKKDFTEDRLLKNYATMVPVDLFKEKIMLDNSYKFDWRPKISKRKKELNKIISEIKCINCDEKDRCNKQ
jgi:hypothetical protein